MPRGSKKSSRRAKAAKQRLYIAGVVGVLFLIAVVMQVLGSGLSREASTSVAGSTAEACIADRTIVSGGSPVWYQLRGVSAQDMERASWYAPGGDPQTGTGGSFTTYFRSSGQYNVVVNLPRQQQSLLSCPTVYAGSATPAPGDPQPLPPRPTVIPGSGNQPGSGPIVIPPNCGYSVQVDQQITLPDFGIRATSIDSFSRGAPPRLNWSTPDAEWHGEYKGISPIVSYRSPGSYTAVASISSGGENHRVECKIEVHPNEPVPVCGDNICSRNEKCPYDCAVSTCANVSDQCMPIATCNGLKAPVKIAEECTGGLAQPGTENRCCHSAHVTPPDPTFNPAQCGNNHCSTQERSAGSCPVDCDADYQKLVCGNGECSADERLSGSCPADCNVDPNATVNPPLPTPVSTSSVGTSTPAPTSGATTTTQPPASVQESVAPSPQGFFSTIKNFFTGGGSSSNKPEASQSPGALLPTGGNEDAPTGTEGEALTDEQRAELEASQAAEAERIRTQGVGGAFLESIRNFWQRVVGVVSQTVSTLGEWEGVANQNQDNQ